MHSPHGLDRGSQHPVSPPAVNGVHARGAARSFLESDVWRWFSSRRGRGRTMTGLAGNRSLIAISSAQIGGGFASLIPTTRTSCSRFVSVTCLWHALNSSQESLLTGRMRHLSSPRPPWRSASSRWLGRTGVEASVPMSWAGSRLDTRADGCWHSARRPTSSGPRWDGIGTATRPVLLTAPCLCNPGADVLAPFGAKRCGDCAQALVSELVELPGLPRSRRNSDRGLYASRKVT